MSNDFKDLRIEKFEGLLQCSNYNILTFEDNVVIEPLFDYKIADINRDDNGNLQIKLNKTDE